ncbi:MAG: RdgB/HAM1 family non-canonical purine NTP pyrophosphatase [Ilumatobacteraceae bacterium]
MNESIPVLVCASANPDKVLEIEQILTGLVDLRPRPSNVPDVDETADTLVGNARLKAEAIRDATSMAAVADDTGLFVDALPGRLGVRTARYAADRPLHATDPYAANRAKLLEELDHIDDAYGRRARFVTVVVVSRPDGTETIVEGECSGTISRRERGDRGFGFDPLFIPDDGDGRTFAEMSDAEKNSMSHRARAFTALATALRD